MNVKMISFSHSSTQDRVRLFSFFESSSKDEQTGYVHSSREEDEIRISYGSPQSVSEWMRVSFFPPCLRKWNFDTTEVAQKFTNLEEVGKKLGGNIEKLTKNIGAEFAQLKKGKKTERYPWYLYISARLLDRVDYWT